jgi:hypothetical protein
MADLSQLSDEDLKKLYADDFKGVSAEGISALKTQQEEEVSATTTAPTTAPIQQGPVAPEFSDYSTMPTSVGQVVGAAQIPINYAIEHPGEAAALGGAGLGAKYLQGKGIDAASAAKVAEIRAQTDLEKVQFQREKEAGRNARAGKGPGPINPNTAWQGGPTAQAQAQAQAAEKATADALNAQRQAAQAAAAEQSVTNKIRNKAASMVTGLAEASPFLASAGKVAGKLLPGAGLALGGAEAYNRAKQGDYLGAGLAGVGGVAGLVPGVGTAINLGATGINAGRDYQKYLEAKRQYEAQQKAMGR